MEKIKIDYQTIAYVRHLLAGKFSNINLGAKMLIEGKTKLSTGEDIADIIERNGKEVVSIIDNLLSKAK